MDPKKSKDTITVLGPFRQSEPATTRSNKHDGGCSEGSTAGSADSLTDKSGPRRAATLSTTSEPSKNASCASVPIPQPHQKRISKSKAKAKHSSRIGAVSPPRKLCGFCRSFSGPNAVCVHPGQPHEVIRKGDRLLVRAKNPMGTTRWEKPCPVRAGDKTREKL